MSLATWLCGFNGLENFYDICDLYEYYDKYLFICISMIYRRSPKNCLENIIYGIYWVISKNKEKKITSGGGVEDIEFPAFIKISAEFLVSRSRHLEFPRVFQIFLGYSGGLDKFCRNSRG